VLWLQLSYTGTAEIGIGTMRPFHGGVRITGQTPARRNRE
jgi:hypothetical protein